ncbi:MAG: DEAD/DEAH box helicase [Bdellovibrionales bacterium]|nr:DEAD/DEAH box helicase [Bdellovibrionales bacterium]
MSSSIALSSFDHLDLKPEVKEALCTLGHSNPTPIQELAIPVILRGDDLVGQAQTGTGKTGAFALPLLSKISIEICSPQVIVLTPTRELALQVSEAFKSYAKNLKGFRVLAVYGGQSMSNQIQSLRKGVHVVVGTPGRIMDHLRRKTLRLDGIQTVVLDEADEMLKMGFISDIEAILEHTPNDKQVALFSATMPSAIRRIAQKHLKHPKELKVESRTSTVETIDQRFWPIAGIDKFDALTRILEAEEIDAAIIFVRTKTATVELVEKLEETGHSCAAMNGDLSQDLREQTINRLKNGRINLVIATDVAARGLDVDRISHVINYDVPRDTEGYVHRIGRTGRAGRKGTAILFVSPREKRMLYAIERATKQQIKEFILPSTKELTKRRIEKFKSKISSSNTIANLETYGSIVDELVCENKVSLRDIAARLCFLLQESKPLIAKDLPVRTPRKDFVEKNRRGSRRESRRNRSDVGMVSYRIEVGRRHGIRPGSIVAAIAETGNIEGRHIGRIQLHDDHSTVDLPQGMPKSVFRNLKRGYVANRPMHLSEVI